MRALAVHGFDRASKYLGAPVGQFIAVNRSDDGVAQIKIGDGGGDAFWFVFVQDFRFARLNGAETATARANIPQNHKGGCALAPTLANIGALGAFADRI